MLKRVGILRLELFRVMTCASNKCVSSYILLFLCHDQYVGRFTFNCQSVKVDVKSSLNINRVDLWWLIKLIRGLTFVIVPHNYSKI